MIYKKSTKIALLAILFGTSFHTMATNTYKVKAGDTLTSIANQFDVSKRELMELNNIKSENTINIGDVIILRDSVAVRYAGKTSYYTVQSGDTFSSIVRKFDTTTAILAELNPNLQNGFNQIYVGQKLIVPSSAAANTVVYPPQQVTPAIVKPDVPKQYTGKHISYTVKRGDTFTGIANRYNIKANHLAKVNNVDTTYKVKIGETLYIPEIADSLRSEPEKPAKINKPTTTTITKKTTIIPRTPEPLPIPEVVNKTKSPLQISSFRYVVKSGDSLLGLSKRYNVTVSTLAELNDLKTTSQLKIGQKLLIPTVK